MAIGKPPTTFSNRTYELCTSKESVSSVLAADPSLAPGDAWRKLYGHHVGKLTTSKAANDAGKSEVSPADLERAAKCGNWGPTQPSELFLRVSDASLLIQEGSGRRAATNVYSSITMPCVP